jgi:HEAT repeat protein
MDSSIISILLGALGFGAGAVVGSQYQKKQDEELYSQRIERRVLEVNQLHEKDLRAQIAQINQEYEAKLAAAQQAAPAPAPVVSSVVGVVPDLNPEQNSAQNLEETIATENSAPPEPGLAKATPEPESVNDSASDIESPSAIPTTEKVLHQEIIYQKPQPQGDLVRQARDSQPQVRAAAAVSLGQKLSRNPQAMNLEQLHQLGLLSADHDPAVAITAVKALGEIRDPRVIPYLIQANRSGYGAVVKAAGAALERYKTMAVPKAATPEPDYPKPKTKAVQFRPSSAYGLGAVSLESVSSELPVVEPLSQVSIANDNEIRMAVQESKIAAWGDSQQVQYVPSLLQYAQSPHSSIRKEVATALGKIADQKPQALNTKPVIDTLGRLSLDRRVSVRYAAIMALGKLQNRAVIPYLQQARGANASAVVKVAAEMLRNLQPLPEPVPSVTPEPKAKLPLQAKAVK